jgi:plasmid replication initiation protein
VENKKGGDLICRRPETIIEARFSLTKRQNDILDIVFSSIEDDSKLRYEIDINKYGALYNIKDKSNIYRDFKKAVRSFELKGFSVTTKSEKGKEHRIYFSWFASIEYVDGESKITLELGTRLKELMLSAKQACFYQIKYSLNFKSIYSQRIYYYLKRFEDTGFRIDNLDELRTKLNCPKSYNIFSNFRLYVLDPAFEEINDNSDISFKYEEIKNKGKITSIKFYIKSNKEDKTIAPLAPTAKNEVSATIEEPEKETQKVMSIMSDSKITALEAKKIYDSSKKNIETIKKVYDDGKNKDIPNFIGWMISMVKPGVYIEPKKNYAKGAFNNYEQRKYDGSDGKMSIDEMEKKLLGWDNDELDEAGKNFQQLMVK